MYIMVKFEYLGGYFYELDFLVWTWVGTYEYIRICSKKTFLSPCTIISSYVESLIVLRCQHTNFIDAHKITRFTIKQYVHILELLMYN